MSRATSESGSTTKRGRRFDGPHSVPFIVPENDEEGARFIVTREAQDILGKIRCPIAPIAIVGKYRTGKSFLLNKLLQGLHIDAQSQQHTSKSGSSSGFEVGPTVEACTKGIWLWSEPLYLPLPESLGGSGGDQQYAVLFIDTE
jgi:Guanylate-binding protein, N-terminal domain